MEQQFNLFLLAAALVGVLALQTVNFVLTIKLISDVEKFGRQLLKVRRHVKDADETEV